MRLTQEQEEIPVENLAKMGWQKGGRTYRWSSGFNRLWAKVRLLRFVAPYCEWCDGNHAQFLFDGQEPSICPEATMVCPCGCGKPFKFDKLQQRQLREKLRIDKPSIH